MSRPPTPASAGSNESSAAISSKDKPRVDAIVETVIYLYTESRRLTKGLARSFGLTGPQLTVIKILEELGDLSLSGLSARIRARNSTVTGIIDRMEREGLVERMRSESDRRIVLIRLTEKGHALARTIEVKPMQLFRSALRSLPKRDLDDLFRILERLQRHVREAVGSEDEGDAEEETARAAPTEAAAERR